MDLETVQTEFFGKTWLFRLATFLFTLATFLCILIATLWLCGITHPANGAPAKVAAPRTLLAAALTGVIGLLCWSHVLARRRPLVRICREGIELNIIGRGSVDDSPVPLSVKLVWLIVTMQGFRRQTGWISWKMYDGVEISHGTAQTLTIRGTVECLPGERNELNGSLGYAVQFYGTEFSDSLDVVARSIVQVYRNPSGWDQLPSFRNS